MAVWSSSTSDRCSTVLGISFLIATTLLNSCLCAPTSADPWWYNPCSSQVERIRHGRSAGDQDIIKISLKIFRGRLQTSILKDLNSLYKELSKTKQPFRAKLPWLKLNRMLNNMKTPTTRLAEFHKALQFFAGTLQKLAHIKIRTNITRFREDIRHRIYKDASEYLKQLLCEVEYTIQHNNEEVPAHMGLKDMKIKLPKQLDLTAVHLLDFNFFKKMKTFVTRTQRMFKSKSRKQNLNKSEKVMKTQKRTKH